jgi:hypothetical protein
MPFTEFRIFAKTNHAKSTALQYLAAINDPKCLLQKPKDMIIMQGEI